MWMITWKSLKKSDRDTFHLSYSLPCTKFLMHSASAGSLSHHNLTNNPLVMRSISPSTTSHSNIGIISRDVAFSDCSFQNRLINWTHHYIIIVAERNQTESKLILIKDCDKPSPGLLHMLPIIALHNLTSLVFPIGLEGLEGPLITGAKGLTYSFGQKFPLQKHQRAAQYLNKYQPREV